MIRMDGTILFIIIVILIVSWAYANDTRECRELIESPVGWCSNFFSNYDYSNIECTEEQESLGLCYRIDGFDWNVTIIDSLE